jgi:SAM-dependent methyltransferase
MIDNHQSIYRDVAQYYTEKLHAHGETPQGVDWNGSEGQFIRFAQLAQVITAPAYTINDIGCGYGALYEFLAPNPALQQYVGIDISVEMIDAGQRRYTHNDRVTFVHGASPVTPATYSVASGIFNVRLDRSDTEWWQYLTGVLDVMDQYSTHGFAFNCLTSYSDAEKMRDYLYYTDPCRLFDYCKRRYSRNVVLLHDYSLYEFTMIVRK